MPSAHPPGPSPSPSLRENCTACVFHGDPEPEPLHAFPPTPSRVGQAPQRPHWASPALRRQTSSGARPLRARRRRTTASALALTPLRSWGRQDPPRGAPRGLTALACVKHLAQGPHVIRAHLVRTDVIIVITGCWGDRGRRKRQPCLSGQSCWWGGSCLAPPTAHAHRLQGSGPPRNGPCGEGPGPLPPSNLSPSSRPAPSSGDG